MCVLCLDLNNVPLYGRVVYEEPLANIFHCCLIQVPTEIPPHTYTCIFPSYHFFHFVFIPIFVIHIVCFLVNNFLIHLPSTCPLHFTIHFLLYELFLSYNVSPTKVPHSSHGALSLHHIYFLWNLYQVHAFF